MPKPQTATNPFYILLLAAGTIFAITCCAYGVMVVQSMKPFPLTSPLLVWLQQWGTLTLGIEIAVLATLVVAAFSTDSYFTREKK
jgi:hypothetical protein